MIILKITLIVFFIVGIIGSVYSYKSNRIVQLAKCYNSPDSLEFKRKVSVVLSNAKTLEQSENAASLLYNIFDNFKNEFKKKHKDLSNDVYDMLFQLLENEMRVSLLERQISFVKRKINENTL